MIKTFLATVIFLASTHVEASFFGDSGFNIESAANSSTTPLAGGATFTGVGELNPYDEVFCQVKADASGAMFYDFSIDGTNWDSTYPVSGYEIDANIPSVHKAVKSGRYFRVRIVNDASAQSFMRLKCYYGPNSELRASANQAAGRDSDAKMVRLYAEPQDEIVLGQRTGVQHFTKFGFLEDIDAADGQLLITANPAKPVLPEILTTAETLSISYDAVNDGASGTGCKSLYFDYIDANGSAASAVHVLGSSSPDTTTFSSLGINRAACSSSGSANTNVGAISVASSSSGGVHAYLPAGLGVTQQAIYHTPSDSRAVAKFLYINVNKISGGGSPRVTVKGWVHNRIINTYYEIFRIVIDTSAKNSVNINEPVGFGLSAGDVLYFTAATDTNNTSVSSLRFSLNRYKNN